MLKTATTVATEIELKGTEMAQVATTSRIKFEEPLLEKRGDLTEVTAGGFGSFSP